jgi:hypothetical protein
VAITQRERGGGERELEARAGKTFRGSKVIHQLIRTDAEAEL